MITWKIGFENVKSPNCFSNISFKALWKNMGLDQDMLKASVSNSIMAVKLIAIEIR